MITILADSGMKSGSSMPLEVIVKIQVSASTTVCEGIDWMKPYSLKLACGLVCGSKQVFLISDSVECDLICHNKQWNHEACMRRDRESETKGEGQRERARARDREAGTCGAWLGIHKLECPCHDQNKARQK